MAVRGIPDWVAAGAKCHAYLPFAENMTVVCAIWHRGRVHVIVELRGEPDVVVGVRDPWQLREGWLEEEKQGRLPFAGE